MNFDGRAVSDGQVRDRTHPPPLAALLVETDRERELMKPLQVCHDRTQQKKLIKQNVGRSGLLKWGALLCQGYES